MKRTLPIIAVVALLAACGGGSDSSSSASTAQELGEVGAVSELKDAAVSAGYSCPSWQQDNVVAAAAESGSCSDSDVFSTYLSTDARDETVQRFKDLRSDIDIGGETTLLVGPNWVINSNEAATLKDALGGTLVTF